MARSNDFDFDAVPLTQGGFYHSAGDAAGNMMIGWGRRGRNKFVQLTQAEISNFLAHAHAMYRTDDPTIKGLLADLAALIAGSKPRWATFADLLAQVEAGDDIARQAATDMNAKLLGGSSLETALADVNSDYKDGVVQVAAEVKQLKRAVPRSA